MNLSENERSGLSAEHLETRKCRRIVLVRRVWMGGGGSVVSKNLAILSQISKKLLNQYINLFRLFKRFKALSDSYTIALDWKSTLVTRVLKKREETTVPIHKH